MSNKLIDVYIWIIPEYFHQKGRNSKGEERGTVQAIDQVKILCSSAKYENEG